MRRKTSSRIGILLGLGLVLCVAAPCCTVTPIQLPFADRGLQTADQGVKVGLDAGAGRDRGAGSDRSSRLDAPGPTPGDAGMGERPGDLRAGETTPAGEGGVLGDGRPRDISAPAVDGRAVDAKPVGDFTPPKKDP